MSTILQSALKIAIQVLVRKKTNLQRNEIELPSNNHVIL